MAEFEFKCPQCGGEVTADDSLAGQVARCPFCGKGVVIPRTRGAAKSLGRNEVERPDGIEKDSGRTENSAEADKMREKKVFWKESGRVGSDTDGKHDGSIVRVLSAEVTLSEQMLFEARRTNKMLIALLGGFGITLLVLLILVLEIEREVTTLRQRVDSVWEGYALRIKIR